MNNARRLRIFLTGVVLGTLVSMVVFHFWQQSQETTVPRSTETASVVMASCDLKAGSKLTAECAQVREDVATQFVPPDTLLAKDLEWHIGKTLGIDVKKGNALRTVDFL